MTVYSQRQRHGVLCHRLGRIARHPHHLDAVSGGCLQIHIVETGAAHQHQLHASLMEYPQHFLPHIELTKAHTASLSVT